jgi:plasmid stabilization system protein ParE
MPQQAWSDKRERQYEHIKDSLEERGTSEDKAEEIAARTVNKERARTGEAGAMTGAGATMRWDGMRRASTNPRWSTEGQ